MLVLLMNNTFLLTEVTEVVADIGQPDCKLTNPQVIKDDGTLESWIGKYSDNEVVMISSDKILTITEPNKTLLDKYLEITQ